jgi:D-lactate dehydrogenase
MRTQSVIPIEWAGKLSGILSRSTGYDHLRFYLEKAGRPIPCGYLPLYCNRAVAEQAALLWLALLRKLPQQTRQFASFNRDGLTGQECEGKRLLVVGVGHIGHEVVRIGKGLGMHVRGVDIVKRHHDVAYVSAAKGLPWADIIVCAMNLTADNLGYFNYRRLKRARRGVFFVNIARGELSPVADLLRLLNEGRLGGVALDVYEHESKLAVALREGKRAKDATTRATLALAKHPNVILTPHNAFNTEEAVERKAQQSIRQVEHFLRHGKFLWPVPKL